MIEDKKKPLLEVREIILVAIFGILGFFASTRLVITFLDKQSPLVGFLIYEAIIYASILILSLLGLAALGHKVTKWHQTLGLLLITFSFFVIFDWTSPYVNIVTHGNADNISNVYFQGEDGAVWYVWHDLVGINDILISRLLTFVFTPMLLTLLGGLLLRDKPKIGG